jgi:hypothetical protein
MRLELKWQKVLAETFKHAGDPSLGRPINEQLAVLLVANPATEKKDRERRGPPRP